ncbi:MAG: VOC family protein [Anaerolineae bacterium]|nr:VOC family protein [Anaerolineae bacterium]
MTRPSIDQQITFLYTKDMEASIRFYEQVLELPLVLDQGGCRIYQVKDAAYIGVCFRPDAIPALSGVIFTLVVPDVDSWYDHLRKNGVPLEKAPALNDAYGIYHCFARDPSGYLIEIQRFLDNDWNMKF